MSGIVEGRNPVLESLLAGTAVEEVLIAHGVRPDGTLDRIREAAAVSNVTVREVPRAELDELSARGAHQGVVARVGTFAYAGLDDVVDHEGPSLLIVLDHVTDPGNLGAVVRSAEALGASGVVIPKARAAEITPIAMKASAGAAAHLPIVRVSNITQALVALKDAGYWVAGASEHASQPLPLARLDDRLVLVLGAEGTGLSRLVEKSCDFLVRIPLSGRTSSLNVAQAATVLAYEWSRRRAE